MKHGHCIKGPSHEKGYNKLDMKRVTKCNTGCQMRDHWSQLRLCTNTVKSSEGPRDIT